MTREEIAIVFREVDELYNELARSIKQPFNRPFIDAAIKYGQRAFQVEQMRCETCEKETHQVLGEPFQCPWRGCGGCFNHKPKVTG